MQRHGCLHVDRYRWQLPVEFGLHSQMEKDKELLPAWTHLTHHLCFEGAQLCTKPKAWQLDLIPTVPPRAAPSKYPWMCECSAQTSDPQHEHTIWSCVLWKLSALRRSAITFISLVHVSLWIYGHRVLFWSTFSLCRQKKSCLFVGPCSWCCLQKAAHLCRRWSHAALTHCSTTSYFWQQPAWADSEHLEKNRVLAERVRFDAQMIWDQAVLRAVILSYVSDTCMWPVFHGKKVSNCRRKFPNQFGFPWKKSPRGHLTPKYYTNTLHIQTLEVRYADHTQCLQAQTPTTELDSLGSLYVGWNVF